VAEPLDEHGSVEGSERHVGQRKDAPLDEVGPGRDGLQPGPQPSGLGHAVRVGEGEHLAGRRRRARVARRTRPDALRADHLRDRAGRLGQRRRWIARPVVDHDDLERQVHVLCRQRGEKVGERRGGVAGGHDDAYGRHSGAEGTVAA
jgi:hypothetical protein